MLVLSRKVGETIVIGNGIVVTVLEMKGRQIRLGIEAPPSVPVWRGELIQNDFREPAKVSERLVVHAN